MLILENFYDVSQRNVLLEQQHQSIKNETGVSLYTLEVNNAVPQL